MNSTLYNLALQATWSLQIPSIAAIEFTLQGYNESANAVNAFPPPLPIEITAKVSPADALGTLSWVSSTPQFATVTPLSSTLINGSQGAKLNVLAPGAVSLYVQDAATGTYFHIKNLVFGTPITGIQVGTSTTTLTAPVNNARSVCV